MSMNTCACSNQAGPRGAVVIVTGNPVNRSKAGPERAAFTSSERKESARLAVPRVLE
jgi:hypothetical protein